MAVPVPCSLGCIDGDAAPYSGASGSQAVCFLLISLRPMQGGTANPILTEEQGPNGQ